MKLLPVIDVAISLIFIFMILSIIASFIFEFLSERLNFRGKRLQRFIFEIFDDTSGRLPNLGILMYDHPLIKNLKYKRKRDPEVIDPKIFSTVFHDIMQHISADYFLSSEKKEFVMSADPADKERYLFIYQEEISDAIRLPDLHALYNQAYVYAPQQAKNQAEPVSELEAARKGIEEWYAAFLLKVSYSYKRNARFYLFLIGFVIAILLKTDALYLTQRLYTDANLRNVFVERAEALAENTDSFSDVDDYLIQTINPGFVCNDTTATDTIKNVFPLGDYIDSTGAVKLDSAGFSDMINFLTAETIKTIDTDSCALEKTKILIEYASALPISRNVPEKFWGKMLMLLGILITAGAISYGAPFWYDILKSLTGLKKSISNKQSNEKA